MNKIVNNFLSVTQEVNIYTQKDKEENQDDKNKDHKS